MAQCTSILNRCAKRLTVRDKLKYGAVRDYSTS
jgi:hypothetical protein